MPDFGHIHVFCFPSKNRTCNGSKTSAYHKDMNVSEKRNII